MSAISSYHPDWQQNRANFILDWITQKYGVGYLQGKTVLEVGAFNGYFGERFKEQGAIVTSVEGRQSNCDRITATYPELNVICADLDRDDWPYGRFDIIVNFGLFYHLTDFHELHLKNCLSNCSLMFFETIVLDSRGNRLQLISEWNTSVTNDQGLKNTASVPTIGYVDAAFQACCHAEIVNSDRLNGSGHVYNWVEQGLDDNGYATYGKSNRKLWIVEP